MDKWYPFKSEEEKEEARKCLSDEGYLAFSDKIHSIIMGREELQKYDFSGRVKERELSEQDQQRKRKFQEQLEKGEFLSCCEEVKGPPLVKPLAASKKDFLQRLAARLPADADPEIQTEDGNTVDIFWGNQLLITLASDDTAGVTNAEGKYKFFQQMNDSIDFVVSSFSTMNHLLQ